MLVLLPPQLPHCHPVVTFLRSLPLLSRFCLFVFSLHSLPMRFHSPLTFAPLSCTDVSQSLSGEDVIGWHAPLGI